MITLKIEGMTCGHCKGAVEQALARTPGVEKVVEVNLERGEAVVEGTASLSALIAAVETEGYRARAA